MKKQRLRIRWLEESLLAIFLIFFSNGQVGEAKTLAKRGSLPLYREDLMPLTVERPSFYDDPPLWTIRLRNQPQGLLEPEAGFYRPIYGILRRKKTVFRTVRPLLPPQGAHLPTAVGPEEKQPFLVRQPRPYSSTPQRQAASFPSRPGTVRIIVPKP
ncbi:hypothetical protein [uncultured Acidaminococcus sp.]|uniref:hypothetical protein n=1 Tax=uncultured Acidaminococcus sp. TaxID=352152 RepID=UPI0025E6A963|nr:hypothetical protein [uncultured Acidaminococcus sp.]